MEARGNPIETDAKVDRPWVAALSDEQRSDPLHTKLPNEEFGTYINDADVMIAISKSRVKGLLAEEVHCIFSERTLAKVQTHTHRSRKSSCKYYNLAIVPTRAKLKLYSLGFWKTFWFSD